MSSSSLPRTGAHRPRRRPGALAIPLVLAIVVVAALVGVRLLGGGADGAGPAASTGARTSATPSASSAAAPSGPQASTGPSSRGTAASPSGPTAAVDRSATVTVLNATRRAGLATRAAATLRSAGWSVTRTGNYRQPPPLTTVYYSGPQLRATARAVSADLPGVQRVERSSQFGDAVVTIVLGSDFPG